MAQQHELQVNPLSVVMPSRMLPSLDGGKLKGAGASATQLYT
jgi:hypothetical protein